MGSTTSNDVINVKPNWGCYLSIFFICFLVRNIYTWTVSTTPQYTFPVWKCMIRLRICAHFRLCNRASPERFEYYAGIGYVSNLSEPPIANDVINVKPNWWCCLWIMVICFLFSNIDTWTFSTLPQYTFTVWKFMIRIRISAHRRICHIRCFGINMTPMWHHCIFIYLIYVMWFITWPYSLRMMAFIFQFFQIPITPG